MCLVLVVSSYDVECVSFLTICFWRDIDRYI